MNAETLSMILLPVLMALSSFMVAWLRMRAQGFAVHDSVLDVEIHPMGLSSQGKRQRAKTLSGNRMSRWTRPRDARLETLIDEALPSVREMVVKDAMRVTRDD